MVPQKTWLQEYGQILLFLFIRAFLDAIASHEPGLLVSLWVIIVLKCANTQQNKYCNPITDGMNSSVPGLNLETNEDLDFVTMKNFEIIENF